MNFEEAKEIVKSVLSEIIGGDAEINDETVLIGGQSLLDSMKLVEVSLALEDQAEELGFEFDWTSDATMSKSRSTFRTTSTLAKEFARQASES